MPFQTENSLSLVDLLKTKVSPAILCAILGNGKGGPMNPSLLYQNIDLGRLPDVRTGDYTYLECIQAYIEHYKYGVEVKVEQEKTKRELAEVKLKEEARLKVERQEARKALSATGSLDIGEMNPLAAAKMKQDIRLGVAKESEIWQKVLITRGDYLSLEQLIELAEPFVMTIRNSLIALSQISPEAEVLVYQAMESLYNLGNNIVEDADADRKGFLEFILAKDIDVEDIEVENGVQSVL